MQTKSGKWLRVALAAWLIGVNGCGMAPTAPLLSSGAANQQQASASGEPSRGGSEQATDPGLSQAPNPGANVVGQPVTPIQPQPPVPVEDDNDVWRPITGQIDMTLNAGSVTVKIPAAAIDGAAEVKVSASGLQAELEIVPASKNSFAVPVTLEFDVRAVEDPRVLSIFWFNEESSQWEPIPSSFDSETGRISAELPHFSLYRVDTEIRSRAGW